MLSTYELYEFYMLKKANTMFTAFQALHRAAQLVEGQKEMTASEITLAAFGMFRERVKDIFNLDVIKEMAKNRA